MSDELEKCPVCQSDKYLNPNMKFVVNPECYHKMCKACVARIFTLGPAPCPICGRQLRMNKFRAQTFSDVHIEKEVDTRRRLARVFNRNEEDFDTLEAYNDYLEEVEMITFNLTQGIDVEATERRVRAYEVANKHAISANSLKEAAEMAEAQEQERSHKQQRIERARLTQKAMAHERIEKEERSAEMLSAMSSGADAERTKRSVNENSKKRLQAKNREHEEAMSRTMKQIKPQLRNRIVSLKQESAVPFSPLLGWGARTNLYTVEDEYEDAFLAQLKRDKAFRAGGARIQDIYGRALFEAFASLFSEPAQAVAADQG